LGLQVNRLIRVSYGPFQLHDLKPGEVEPVRRRVLIEQLGPRTAKLLGLNDAEEEKARRQRRKSAASEADAGSQEIKDDGR